MRLLIVGCGVLYGFLVVDVVAGGLVTKLDETVAESVGPDANESRWAALANIGSFGVSGTLVVIAALVCAQRLWRVWPVLLAAGAVATMSLVVLVTKVLVGRPGPPGVEPAEDYPGYFPSGHTATSVVCLGLTAFLVMTLFRPGLGDAGGRARGVAIVVGVGGGVLAGASSVLSGYHWLSDVLGGLLVGVAVLALALTLAPRVQAR